MDISTIVAIERRRTSRLAIAALVMSLLGSPIMCLLALLYGALLSLFVPQVNYAFLDYLVFLVPLAPAALLVSVISLVRIYRRRSTRKGLSFAWAAALMSVISIVMWLALVWFFLYMMSIG